MREHVTRIADGDPGVLTTEPVQLLEPTSGSTGPNRLVPYTATLRRQFQRAVKAWVWHTADEFPAAFSGRSYWSISPPGQQPASTPAGIPIGFDDDAAYLARHQRWLLDRLLVRPPPQALRPSPDRSLDNFRFATLLCLVAAEDLSLISVWSPTFLLGLVEAMEQWRELVCTSLATGRVQLPGPPDRVLIESLQRQIGRQPHRAAECIRLAGEPFEQLWPRLGLVSCWGDGASARFLPELVQQFPTTPVQPKGLLATEGVVTIPRAGDDGSVLAMRSHVFEFLPVSRSSTTSEDLTRLPRELTTGELYEVVITTGGGLYRYRLGDTVEVVGWERETPRLRFVARRGTVSDIVGEKLNEYHVQSTLDSAISTTGLDANLALLTPVRADRPGYRLFLQTNSRFTANQLKGVAGLVESGLCDNPNYDLARRLGQLQPLCISGWRGTDGWQRVERAAMDRGRALGDIKPASLDTWDGWDEVLGDLVQLQVAAESR